VTYQFLDSGGGNADIDGLMPSSARVTLLYIMGLQYFAKKTELQFST
jgi:hypothetical protein